MARSNQPSGYGNTKPYIKRGKMQEFDVTLSSDETYRVIARNFYEALTKAEQVEAALHGEPDTFGYYVDEFISSDNRDRRLRDGFALAGGR